MEFDENLLNKNANQQDANSVDTEIKRLKREIELRDNQIETLKKSSDGKNGLLHQKIVELTNYIEDLKKFQLDKDYQINELNKILENKEKEIANLKEKNKNENQADAELSAENDKLQKEIHKLNGRLNDLEIKMYKANDDRSILEKLNKELAEKINNFESDLDEKIKSKEDEVIDLRNKILELETLIEEKDQNLNNIEGQQVKNEEIIAKLKEELHELKEEQEKKEVIHEEKEDVQKEEKLKENQLEEENKEKVEANINIDDYVLKSVHEEMLEENREEINTLINTINVLKRDKEDLEMKISNMKTTVQEITQRLEVELEKHSSNSDEKSQIVQR